MIQQTRLAPLPQKEGGFTLIEILIVVAILGVLMGIGYPNYLDYMQKSRRSDATSTLMQIAAKEEQYFSDNRTYTDDLTQLNYDNAGTDADNDGTADAADPVVSENGYYGVAVYTPNSYEFTLTATPQNEQANDSTCDVITLNSEGVRAAEDSSSNDTTDTCW